MAGRTDTAKRRARGNRDEVSAVRAFNRFYTKKIGLLGRGFMGTPYTLTEARIIWEIGRTRGAAEVADIRSNLDLDPGYLSRILAGFARGGLVIRERSREDGRRQVVRLSGSGRAAFRSFDRRSSAELGALLDRHTEVERQSLVEAMGEIRAILEDPERERRLELRGPEPGDHGWVLERHAAVYSQERGWGEAFEAYCGQVIVDFIARDDREHERCWIAELDGVRCGSIYCTRRTEDVAQVRLLLVDPWARGCGAGAALADACVDFAREAGYRQIMLFTNSLLTSARRIYEGLGFEFRAEQPEDIFDGDDSVGQEFWLSL
ncbi:MAG TPA: bifunctional helix-turn-helix transcriptional regulator/GNAT family N-acetyltransferase [Solirubrobacterales bacterium]|nr:bifunctional helix-turn-helix transcriptional regulator/GNAT family N-acetyltransferase [Solirubrobacterales bacterium]